MKFDKFSKALKSLSLNSSSVLELNDQFSVVVLNLNVSNQVYNARSAEYSRKVPELAASSDFFTNLFKFNYTPEGINFVANVLLLDWSLKDDDGKTVPFSVDDAVEMLSDDRFGSVIFTKIIGHATNTSNFEIEWEKELTKN